MRTGVRSDRSHHPCPRPVITCCQVGPDNKTVLNLDTSDRFDVLPLIGEYTRHDSVLQHDHFVLRQARRHVGPIDHHRRRPRGASVIAAVKGQHTLLIGIERATSGLGDEHHAQTVVGQAKQVDTDVPVQMIGNLIPAGAASGPRGGEGPFSNIRVTRRPSSDLSQLPH